MDERRDIHGPVILAERNPRIRSFLAREFEGRGALVREAGDGRLLARALEEGPGPGVVVLDLEIALLDEGLDALAASGPWKLVIHALLPDHADHPAMALAEAVVEKGGDTGLLLATVAAVSAAEGGDGPEDGA